MKTIVRHNRLNCYDFCHPKEKSESYYFIFDESNKETKTVTFEYSEDDAPQLDCNTLPVLELIDELESYKSRSFLYSSSYSHIGEKSHKERIAIARKWAEENAAEDYLDFSERESKRADSLQEKVNAFRKSTIFYKERALEFKEAIRNDR